MFIDSNIATIIAPAVIASLVLSIAVVLVPAAVWKVSRLIGRFLCVIKINNIMQKRKMHPSNEVDIAP